MAEEISFLPFDELEEDDVVEEKYVEDYDTSDEDETFTNTEEKYYYDEFKDTVKGHDFQPNSNMNKNNFQPISNRCQKYTSKMNPVGNCRIGNELGEFEKKMDSNRKRIKDKADRATVEQVLDAKTRVVLSKLMGKGIFSTLHGTISTGKEANVYYGKREKGESPVAIKIFKTSILVFKKRAKYVAGDMRFPSGLAKNPRRMILRWSEKEFRNLKRMYAQGINVPIVYEWRSHIIVMEFIGENGESAPKLKDVELSEERWLKVYRQVVIMMWKLHHHCRLVHADLSEYNMLYLNGKVYVIDVSQSVEASQRRAFSFLRKDIKNVTTFFRKKGVPAMTLTDLFKFIVDPNINDANMEEVLDTLSDKYSSRESCELTKEEAMEDNILMEINICKSLFEIQDVEKEINLAKAGKQSDLCYKSIVGLTEGLSVTHEPDILRERREREEEQSQANGENQEDQNPRDDSRPNGENQEHPNLEDESQANKENQEHPNPEDESQENEENQQNSNPSDDEENSDNIQSNFVHCGRPKHETTEERKLRKRQVKDQQAEKRKNKIKKNVKKSAVKKTKKVI